MRWDHSDDTSLRDFTYPTSLNLTNGNSLKHHVSVSRSFKVGAKAPFEASCICHVHVCFRLRESSCKVWRYPASIRNLSWKSCENIKINEILTVILHSLWQKILSKEFLCPYMSTQKSKGQKTLNNCKKFFLKELYNGTFFSNYIRGLFFAEKFL